MARYEVTRQRHIDYAQQRLGDHLERISWPAERLRAERNRRLRALLQTARDRSPWHRSRLAAVDIDSIDEDRLGELPVMTKADLMANFDTIVSDRRVTLGCVNTHLAGLSSDTYLFGEFHAFASGGTSGMRGAFIWGWDAWATCWLTHLRRQEADRGDLEDDPRPPTLMMVAAEHPWHLSAALGQTFASPARPVHRFPVTMPLAAIVDGLNRTNGQTLMIYASMLAVLVSEARAGRLNITPRRIITVAEPLLPEVRSAAQDAWGAPIANSWGTSEGGIVARGCYAGAGMHLSDDLVIVEPVDQGGQPVPRGAESAKVYLTNLFNPVLPLIRYEITDQVRLLDEPCACGSEHRRIADIQGRLDDVFTYPGGVSIHPHLFRSVLGRDPAVLEYQVLQTCTGADILLRTSGAGHPEQLARALQSALVHAGLSPAVVTMTAAEHIPRAGAGKLKRFVPLSTAGTTASERLIAGRTSRAMCG
jgi:phenylacetate-CoA ligase